MDYKCAERGCPNLGSLFLWVVLTKELKVRRKRAETKIARVICR